MEEIFQMKTVLGVLFITLLSATASNGRDSAIVTTSTVLTSGPVSGVGGGKQAKFGMFDVCRADKVNNDAVEIATAKALANLGLSLDPPSTDVFTAIKIGNEWKTSPSNVAAVSLKEYNSSTELKLVDGYRYYVTYYGRVALKGSSLILQTMTSLSMGNTSQESQPYTGDFDPEYFHTRLQSEILKDLKNDGCS
jgi:hypothetical protein